MSENHKVSFKTYLTILLVLLFLTVVTVSVAQVDFGALNALIAHVDSLFKRSFGFTLFYASEI